MFYRIYFVFFLVIALPGTLHAACLGKIDKGITVTGQTDYDPFNPNDTTEELLLTVRNTGDEACSYALAFRTPDGTAKLGKTLSYFLTSQNGRSLLINTTANVPAASRLTRPVPVNGTENFYYRIVIPRGQFAAPGNFADTLTLELYALDSSGQSGSTPVDNTTLRLSYTVPQILSVNIKGAGTTTTVDFGELTLGKQRAVIIQTRSNHSYDLNISSANQGAMKLTPPVPNRNWTVGYEARINGQLLDLHNGASVQKLPPTHSEDASYSLLVTVGDTAKKRAGKYEDVITLQINAAAP
ncbi:MAG: hypothetical protein P8Y36_05765 [Alphaproteobacteria bacterium]